MFFGIEYKNSSGNPVTGLTVKLISGATEFTLADASSIGYYSNNAVTGGYYELWDNTTGSLSDSGQRYHIGQIVTDGIKDVAISNLKIADGAIDTDQIANGAVDSDKIANNAVVADKIPDGEISPAKLNSDAKDSANLTHEGDPLDEKINALSLWTANPLYYPLQVAVQFTATATTKTISRNDILALTPVLDAETEYLNPDSDVKVWKYDSASHTRTDNHSVIVDIIDDDDTVPEGYLTWLDVINLSVLEVGKTYIVVITPRQSVPFAP